MEELGFDIGGLLTEEEADKLFEEQNSQENLENTEETEQENEHADDGDVDPGQEGVGMENNETGNSAITESDDGSSPNIYSSIASALKDDGLFPDLEDSDFESIETADDFAELFEKAVTARYDERLKRMDAALKEGVPSTTVKKYEDTIAELNAVTPQDITAEGEDGDNLRKQLIYNERISRGYTHEKALKEVEKSFKANLEIEDAKDALEALKKHFTDEYEGIREKAHEDSERAKEIQKKQASDFKKMVLDSELKVGETTLDKKTCQKVYDAVSKPVYKDPDSGQLLTAVQKFQKENPLEFLKQLGMWYVLTDGGKSVESFAKGQAAVEKNKAIRELSSKLNTTALNRDGSLKYNSTSSGKNGEDPLMSDGWKIGW